MLLTKSEAYGAVPIDLVIPNWDFNVRGEVLPRDVADLRHSIKERGQLHPITLRKHPEKEGFYEIVSGHRRFVACKSLGLPSVIAVIKDMSDEEAEQENSIENIMRVKLNPLQLAFAVQREFRRTGDKSIVANVFQQSISWVDNRLRTLTLDERIFPFIAEGIFTDKHIHDLSNLPTFDEQVEAAREVRRRIVHGGESKTKVTVKLEHKNKEFMRPKCRTREQMFRMITHVRGNFEDILAMRCLAWAAGQISTSDLNADMVKFAEEQGLQYTPLSEDI